MRRLNWVLLLLGLFFLLAVGSFVRKSPTYDETVHLYAGYSYLRWHDFRVNPEHPPLAKALAALPLLALDLNDPRALDVDWEAKVSSKDFNWWREAHRMVFLENDAEALFFYAKLPMIALGALLGLFIYRWTKGLYGAGGGLVALFLYCLDPNILAHSAIIHTDVPFAAFFFFGCYYFYLALEHLTWPRLALVALFFGLSAVTKFSFWIIFPTMAAVGLARIFAPEPWPSSLVGRPGILARGQRAQAVAVCLGLTAIAVYVCVWAAYGLRFAAGPSAAAASLPLARAMPEAPVITAWVLSAARFQLLPEAFLYGMLFVAAHLERPAYLLGMVSDDGFWSYFPVAFMVKTPVPLLLLLGAAAFRRPGVRSFRSAEWCLLVPVFIYFAFAVWSRLNIGARHLLPIYPFLFVLAGAAAAALWRDRLGWKPYAVAFIALWHVVSAFVNFPHYLSYFNELAGGSKNGHRVLVDSSLDWGQDLKGLKLWMDENNVDRIQLAYFGTADPMYYGIRPLYLPGSIVFSPRPDGENLAAPGYLAVSATYVYGVHSGQPLKARYLALRDREPLARIGRSILVYKTDRNWAEAKD